MCVVPVCCKALPSVAGAAGPFLDSLGEGNEPRFIRYAPIKKPAKYINWGRKMNNEEKREVLLFEIAALSGDEAEYVLARLRQKQFEQREYPAASAAEYVISV